MAATGSRRTTIRLRAISVVIRAPIGLPVPQGYIVELTELDV